MSTRPYGIICPITLACDQLEPRWTIPILTEMWSGSSRFSDIRRGVGNISSALLSKRLSEMRDKGLIDRIEDPATGHISYLRTDMSIALEPALNALAVWAQQYVAAEQSASENNLPALMFKLRRGIIKSALPARRVVVRFHFSDVDCQYDTYWLLVQPNKDVELCTSVPGFDVDLFVETTLTSMTRVLLARSTVAQECDQGHTFISGDAALARTANRWFPKSDYADVEGIAVA
ncbi:MAG: helix-turn-helix domain-containing protein [Pseudomonadota bacterium]